MQRNKISRGATKVLHIFQKGIHNTEHGITLVALIITVIVLLILAMVSIRLVMNGGIIDKAEKGTESYSAEEELEQIKLAVASAKLAGNGFLTAENLNTELQKVFTKFRYDLDGVPYCEIIYFLCYGEKGYGTAMMNCLKDYLSLYNVRYIKGTVSIFDKYDFNDKQHYNRLRHFYEKLGYSFYQIGKGEYMRLELNNSKEMRERIYLKESYYEQEFDCYRNLVSDLLVSHRIKISEIDRNIRIYEPAYFVYAVKFSENLDEMLEVLSLLCADIDSLSADSEQREELISYLSLFVCPIRYFTNNERMISFVKNARNKYFSKKS